MFTRLNIDSRIRNVILASAMLSLAGCSDSDPAPVETETPADTNVVSFAISADASQEIPSNASAATATGTFTLDQTTLLLSGSVMVSGTDATLAHIHQAFAGSNGIPVITLDIDGDTISVPDGTMLAEDQITSMLAGEYYLNIHSAASGAGEIRDQLTRPGLEVIQVALSGDNEVPAVSSVGTGMGYVTLDTVSGAIQVRVITTGITTPTFSHVHLGLVGANGSPIVALTQDEAVVGNFAASGETLEAAALTSVLDGGTYLNVHSAENQGGELRGQIVR